ncbi:MAG: porin family protein [Prevotellaceae bacterium]|nr:porin family protein [Prevotellaceae bacterium]MDY2749222.1 porin family protein [Prevotella sp.]
MKKLSAMAVALLTATSMFAQPEAGTFTLQPSAGVAIATLSGDGTKAKVGFQGRFEGAYQMTDAFAVSVGLGCSQYGAKEEGTNTKKNLAYITVPVLANYYLVNGLAVKTGVEVGFKSSAEFKNGDEKEDIEGVKSVIMSIPVGASYEYKNVVLDARYNIGVTKAFKEGNAKQSAFVVTLGYKFKL